MDPSLQRNKAIKSYISSHFALEDDHLRFIRSHTEAEGLPSIEVPALVGKMLFCLASLKKPERILEIGTLGGYSTLWLARTLVPQGRLISLEISSHHAAIAREHLAQAGIANNVEIRVGPASLLLKEMQAMNEPPFDVIFIDADKENYPLYLEEALKLSKTGTLLLSDNLIPKGDAIGKPENDEAKGIYTFNQMLSKHPRLSSVLLPTIVGESGRIDALGFSIVL